MNSLIPLEPQEKVVSAISHNSYIMIFTNIGNIYSMVDRDGSGNFIIVKV